MWGETVSVTATEKFQTENIVDDLRRPLWNVTKKIPTEKDFLSVLARYELFAGDSFELIDEKGNTLKGESSVQSYVTSSFIEVMANALAGYKADVYRKDWSAPVRVYLNDNGHYIYESKNFVDGGNFSVTAIVSRDLTELYAKTVIDGLGFGGFSFVILFVASFILCTLLKKRQAYIIEKVVNEQRKVLLVSGEKTNVGKKYGKHMDQLSDLIISLNAQANEAHKTNINILQDVSHETSSILTEIKQSVDLIRYYGLEDRERVEGQLERIDKSVFRINDIQGAFIDLAKIDNPKTLMPPSNYLIKELVNYTIHEASSEYPQMEFIQCCCTNEDKLIRIHREHFKMIMKILLDNAVKYSIDSKEVSICIIDIPSYKNKVSVEVKNWGVYIPENERGRIFERYYRGRNVRNISGLGIGLHIIKKIIKMYDGDIIVKSQPSGETSFTIVFPEIM